MKKLNLIINKKNKKTYQEVVKNELLKDSTFLIKRQLFHKRLRKLIILVVKLLINIIGIISIFLEQILIFKEDKIEVNERFVKVFELFISSIFLFETLYEVISSTKRSSYIFSFHFLLDILTILPGFLTLKFSIYNGFIIALSFFKNLRIFRIFSVLFNLIYFKEIVRFDDEDQHDKIIETSDQTFNLKMEFYKITSHLFCMIYISTFLFLTIQDVNDEGILFHPSGKIEKSNPLQILYFILVTLTTVGFGDFTPAKPIVRVFLTFILIIYITIISSDMSALIETINNFSIYDVECDFKNHIIIIGKFSSQNLKKMLMNFYSESILGEEIENKFLIVQNEEPTFEMKNIINDKNLKYKVKYLYSDINKMHWIEKSKLHNAIAVFAFADKPLYMKENNFRETQENILYICKNIKNRFPKKRFYLYLHLTMDYWSIGAWLRDSKVLYANLFKNFFIALAIQNRSTYNFLAHIICCFNKNNDFLIPNYMKKNWNLRQFKKSFKQNIQKSEISDYFINWKFSDLKRVLYFSYFNEKKNKIIPCIIIGLGIKFNQREIFQKSNKIKNLKIIINEENHLIKKGDIVYFISSNNEMCNFISKYSKKDYQIYLKNNFIAEENKSNDNDKNEYFSLFSSILSNFSDKNDKFTLIRNLSVNIEEEKYNYYNLFNRKPFYDISNHIILIGDVKNYSEIITILRKYTEKPIIIFLKENIYAQKWKNIQKETNLFYLFGSYTNLQHIEYLKIEKCFKVVILPFESSNNLFPDSDIILVTRIIKDKYPKANLLIEFADENSLKFFDKRPAFNSNTSSEVHYNYPFWPNVINGTVFLNGLFYIFFSRCFFDEDFFKLMKEITGLKLTGDMSSSFIKSNSYINFCTSKKNRMIHTLTISSKIQKRFMNYGQLMWYILNYSPELIPLGYEKGKTNNLSFSDSFENKSQIDFRNSISSEIFDQKVKLKKKKLILLN